MAGFNNRLGGNSTRDIDFTILSEDFPALPGSLPFSTGSNIPNGGGSNNYGANVGGGKHGDSAGQSQQDAQTSQAAYANGNFLQNGGRSLNPNDSAALRSNGPLGSYIQTTSLPSSSSSQTPQFSGVGGVDPTNAQFQGSSSQFGGFTASNINVTAAGQQQLRDAKFGLAGLLDVIRMSDRVSSMLEYRPYRDNTCASLLVCSVASFSYLLVFVCCFFFVLFFLTLFCVYYFTFF